jgi:hydrogenase expression/formation protein HypE
MKDAAPSCPIPARVYEQIVLGHGSGGQLTHDLLTQLFLPALGNEIVSALEDAASCPIELGNGARLAFTTDAFVVQPLFFPGGDIGRLAVCGTVNDLAASGAVPLYLGAAFILEEGLAVDELERIVGSMAETCRQARVTFASGDTKVVDRGKGDKLFVTTSGIGVIPSGRKLSIHAARPGDRILVSGTLGDHGIAILSVRQGLEFDTVLESDCAPLGDLARAVLEVCPAVRCMRDPTRGGLAATLHELAAASRVGVHIREAHIPLRAEVRAACELLGLDPLHVASEGKLVIVVPEDGAEQVLAAMRAHPSGRQAALIGEVVAADPGVVTMTSLLGSRRLVLPLMGEQLPRIC